MIIAIDGPAGSGKSSTARAVAERLGFRHLDSGAFYRTLTLAALRAGPPPEQWQDLGRERLDALGVGARDDGDRFVMRIHDQDVDQQIRSPEVNAHVSEMARVPAVRHWLLSRLRAAADCDVVADGRDMGTVVFPDARLKVFLIADPETRARRRLAEMGNPDPDTHQVRAETRRLLARDRIDSEREAAPLRKADDAIVVDTTALTFDEQVGMIETLGRSRGANAPAP
ncbi:MAG TPA: (d)CMP kinase [Longimicrobiales bacterium]|nr:(d)CMP kinase [Longimicrobiales bacterium]